MSTGLPPVSDAALPADVRTGSPQRRKTYEAALSFERTLLGQLTTTMAKTAQPDDDADTDAATKTMLSMLPDTLADALVRNGGIGLARTLVPPTTTDKGTQA